MGLRELVLLLVGEALKLTERILAGVEPVLRESWSSLIQWFDHLIPFHGNLLNILGFEIHLSQVNHANLAVFVGAEVEALGFQIVV